MGTSISHHSQRNTNWKPVLACYKNSDIPEIRVVNEIWRASENDEKPISSEMKSETVYSCYKVVNSSKSPEEALQKFKKSVLEVGGNSMLTEFARRAIHEAFQSKSPIEQWTKRFFSEVTNYVVSRDASGFVGERCRNKSVKELIDFKKNISANVREIIEPKKSIRTQKEWESFVDKSIETLKSSKGR